MTPKFEFETEVAAALRSADQQLRTCDPGELTARYSIARETMSSIAQVDAFFIGIFVTDSSMVIPYLYEHDVQLPATVTPYGPGSMSHWVRTRKSTYTFAQDDGSRLSLALPIGNPEEASRDVVFAPLRDLRSGEISGVMSMHSLVPNQYDEQVVAAAEWMGEALMLSLERDQHIGEKSARYAQHPELNSSHTSDWTELFNRAVGTLDTVSIQLAQLVEVADDQESSLLSSIVQVRNGLERAQSELAAVFMEQHNVRLTAAPDDYVLHMLTAREREIALLIARKNHSNARLADELGISIKTVKTHVGNILRKLGVSQRSAIGYALDDLDLD